MKNFNKSLALGIMVSAITFMSSCSSDDGPSCDSSNPVTATTMVGPADCGSDNGTITISASGGNGQYEYSIDGGTFAASNVLSGLAVGDHEITIRDGAKCSTTTSVAVTSGVSFATDVAPIIEAKCAIPGCHVAGTGRLDLQVFTALQNNALDVKTRTQNGTMPRTGVISTAEIQTIACWVDGGAMNN